MGKFELQTPVSQLLNALKSQFFACELYSNRLFQTIQKNSTISAKSFLWRHHFRTLYAMFLPTFALVFCWYVAADTKSLSITQCLRKWGFRRCEDICWIKTNKTNPGNTKYLEPIAVFQHTKEHCLMGIRGTVRRSTDGDFIHANVDIDLIITEEVSS